MALQKRSYWPSYFATALAKLREIDSFNVVGLYQCWLQNISGAENIQANLY